MAYQHTASPKKYILESTHLPPILLITSKGDKTFSYQIMCLYNDLKFLKKLVNYIMKMI